MLDAAQLQDIGQNFVGTLLVMKHNGAVDKCRDAFFMVASRCGAFVSCGCDLSVPGAEPHCAMQ